MKKKKAKRTTHRSTKGKKLYAVRDKKGKFKDIQTYKRAQGRDMKLRSREEALRIAVGALKKIAKVYEPYLAGDWAKEALSKMRSVK